MESACQKRTGLLQRALDVAGADALLVTHPPNIFYLCGFTGDSGALLVEGGAAILFTDGRFTVQAREELEGARPRIVSGPSLAAVGKHLRRRRRRRVRVAFEAARLTVAQKQQLHRATGPGVRWFGVQDWVERLRAIKDAQEIERMREAARLASRVIVEVLPLLKPGVREVELAAELEYRMRRRGASGPAFETIVASGARGALPHARPTSKLLERKELVVIDMGAILRHYCSDLTRTVYLGRAPSRIRRWYRAVLEAGEAAREALRPGVRAADVDAAARKVLGKFRLDAAFVHSTGHGVGLEIHEAPRLGRGQKETLEAGNVVTVEPGVYFEGIGGIRVEDELVVGRRGTEVLTTAHREFLEL